MTVLSWLEMREEDQPAEEIWLDNEAIEAHFAWVKEKYSAQSRGEDVPDPGSWDGNELTKGMK